MNLKYQLEVQPSVPDSSCKRDDMKEGQAWEALLCVWQAHAPLGITYNHSAIGPQC